MLEAKLSELRQDKKDLTKQLTKITENFGMLEADFDALSNKHEQCDQEKLCLKSDYDRQTKMLSNKIHNLEMTIREQLQLIGEMKSHHIQQESRKNERKNSEMQTESIEVISEKMITAETQTIPHKSSPKCKCKSMKNSDKETGALKNLRKELEFNKRALKHVESRFAKLESQNSNQKSQYDIEMLNLTEEIKALRVENSALKNKLELIEKHRSKSRTKSKVHDYKRIVPLRVKSHRVIAGTKDHVSFDSITNHPEMISFRAQNLKKRIDSEVSEAANRFMNACDKIFSSYLPTKPLRPSRTSTNKSFVDVDNHENLIVNPTQKFINPFEYNRKYCNKQRSQIKQGYSVILEEPSHLEETRKTGFTKM